MGSLSVIYSIISTLNVNFGCLMHGSLNCNWFDIISLVYETFRRFHQALATLELNPFQMCGAH